MKTITKVLFIFLLSFFIFSPPKIEARSGCCSHHGGVCGCGCCDGSGLSYTCAPYYPECSGDSTHITTYVAPIVQPTAVLTRPIATRTPTRVIIRVPTIAHIPTRIPTLRPTATLTPNPTTTITPTPTLTQAPSPNLINTIIPTPATIVEPNKDSGLMNFFKWLFRKR